MRESKHNFHFLLLNQKCIYSPPSLTILNFLEICDSAASEIINHHSQDQEEEEDTKV